MCLILLAYKISPEYPLILLANRDEFYNRTTRPATFWPEQPNVLAGKDLLAGGTWLGVTKNNRLAAITNFREPNSEKKALTSRGQLTMNFLSSQVTAENYLEQLSNQSNDYAGFNLLIDDGDQLLYYSNRHKKIETLQPGLYGLSNHLINSPWPKVTEGLNDLKNALQYPEPENLWPILENSLQAADQTLPDTGVGIEIERFLSARFIHSPDYGTRASTIIIKHRNGATRFMERNFDENGEIMPVTDIIIEK